MELASHISVLETAHSYHVRIANPWKKGTLLHTYTFTDSTDTDYRFSRNVNTVHIPLKRVVVMTNSLAHLMVELGVEDCIAGVCEPEYISDSLIRARLADGLATATLVYCIGPLSMLGPVISALQGDHTFLFTNATLDLVTATIFGSTYGVGMLLAAPVLFLWQGMFYCVALLSSTAVSEALMAELLIVGGL